MFCFDQLRHIEEAEAQLSAIIEGHKKLPEAIVSDFLRLLSVQQSNIIWICGTSDTQITTTREVPEQHVDFNWVEPSSCPRPS